MFPITTHKLKRLHLVFVFVFTTSFVFSQEDFSKYKFISPQHNHLTYSKDSSSFLLFFNKLNNFKTNNQSISIVHIGGSHVQGGIWSNTFTRNFQEQFKTSGGGYFSFPYKMARTNSQPYMTSFTNGKWRKCRAIGKDFCLPLGMSAMSITTNDSANNFGALLTKQSICKSANVVRVYHNFNSSFEFEPQAGEGGTFQKMDNEKWGYTSFKFSQSIDSIHFKLIRLDTARKDFTLYGLSFYNDLQPGFFLAGLGANGASSVSFLRCSEFPNQLKSVKADLVIISLGVNDTQSKGFEKEVYIEHYDSLITIIKKANPGVAILLTTTTDNYIKRRTSNKRTLTAREAMLELMNKHHVAIWDLFSLMGGYKSMTKWYKAGLAARDKVHFNARGYTMLGDMMYQAVYKSYLNNKK